MDPMGNKNLRVVCFPEFDGRTAPHPAAMKLIEAVVTWRRGCSQEIVLRQVTNIACE